MFHGLGWIWLEARFIGRVSPGIFSRIQPFFAFHINHFPRFLIGGGRSFIGL
jgi:hypothetical protein